MEEIALSRTGKLYTFTIVRQAPAGFRAPYATALVDLPEGVRIFAQLT
ncbi:MAG: benzoylsuccinyl-CoA thiolase, partial [Anaerolineae bacterium]|nr:benzoylsuccinyl-CoA thiolase [Anaerolineae bacterium]